MKRLRDHRHALNIVYIPMAAIGVVSIELVGVPFVIAALIVAIVVALVASLIA